mmetsp:Transcript_21787/g.30531  ORF Transcript_21787/g.30531 Transcript_21787/m.30531 type:complete len:679 (+) Transcript_21787:514-2550(+)
MILNDRVAVSDRDRIAIANNRGSFHIRHRVAALHSLLLAFSALPVVDDHLLLLVLQEAVPKGEVGEDDRDEHDDKCDDDGDGVVRKPLIIVVLVRNARGPDQSHRPLSIRARVPATRRRERGLEGGLHLCLAPEGDLHADRDERAASKVGQIRYGQARPGHGEEGGGVLDQSEREGGLRRRAGAEVFKAELDVRSHAAHPGGRVPVRVADGHDAAIQGLHGAVGVAEHARLLQPPQRPDQDVELLSGHGDGVSEDVPVDALGARGRGERARVVVEGHIRREHQRGVHGDGGEGVRHAGGAGEYLPQRSGVGESRVGLPLHHHHAQHRQVALAVNVDEVDLGVEPAPVEEVLRDVVEVDVEHRVVGAADLHRVPRDAVQHQRLAAVGDVHGGRAILHGEGRGDAADGFGLDDVDGGLLLPLQAKRPPERMPDGGALICLVVPISSCCGLLQGQHALIPWDLCRGRSSRGWAPHRRAGRGVSEGDRAPIQRLEGPVRLPARPRGLHSVELLQEDAELRGCHLNRISEYVPHDVLRAGGGGQRPHVVIEAPVGGEELVEGECFAGLISHPLLVRHDLGEAPCRREGGVEPPLLDLHAEDREVAELIGVYEVYLHGEEPPVEGVLREGVHVELQQGPRAAADDDGVVDRGEVKHERDPGVRDGEGRGAVVEHHGSRNALDHV